MFLSRKSHIGTGTLFYSMVGQALHDAHIVLFLDTNLIKLSIIIINNSYLRVFYWVTITIIGAIGLKTQYNRIFLNALLVFKFAS